MSLVSVMENRVRLSKLYNVAKDIPSERKRLAQHPYETGDIERGTVKTERKQQIQKEYILIKRLTSKK
jgi:hypothetical protein